MALIYNVIEIFTSESARVHGKSIADAVIQHVRAQKVAARCIVTRGIAGCYENGEIATQKLVEISYNMPLKIEVILPAAELDRVLPGIEEMVTDGIVVVEEMRLRTHRTGKRLIPSHLRVRDAMTSSPTTVHAVTPVREVIRILISSNYNSLPVVDEREQPIGMITQGDLIERAGMPIRLGLLAEFGTHQVDAWLDSLPSKTAEEVMSRPVVTITEDKPLSGAVGIMLRSKLKRLPVVDAQGKIAGILSRFDIFRTISVETPDWEALARHSVELRDARFVRDIMQRDTYSVLPDTPIEESAKIIDTNAVQRVAVVDPNGKLLGLISDRDLLSKFSEHRGSMWNYLLSKVTFGETAQFYRELFAQSRVHTGAEVMKKDLVTVREETPIEEAVRLMVTHRLKRLPVVNQEDRFQGMVSRDSLLRVEVVE